MTSNTAAVGVRQPLLASAARVGSKSLEGSVGKVLQVLPFQRFSVATPPVSEIPHAAPPETATRPPPDRALAPSWLACPGEAPNVFLQGAGLAAHPRHRPVDG